MPEHNGDESPSAPRSRTVPGPGGLRPPPGPDRKFARIVTTPPGPRSRELVEAEAPFLAPGIQNLSQLAGIALSHGEGAVIEDADGNRYLDFVAGICVSSLGHGHPAPAQAAAEQARKITAGSFTTAPRASLVKRIAGLTPAGAGLTRTQLYSGGAEAVESALRLARAHTRHYEVVGFWGGFHGKTGGVLPILGSDFKHGLGPLAPGMHLVPYADCYRCPFGAKYPECGMLCVEFLREAVKKQTAGSIAAVIAEPIQGTSGNVVPPREFLPAVREVAHENGALFIADEMITGFGRTGRMFGSEHSGVRPDIMTVGKGFGAGFPVTGVISTDDIVRAEPWSRPSFSSSSYGGNPLACAVADATVRTIVEQDLAGNAARVGAQLLAGLRPMVERYPFVGEVRGEGLLIGLELVKDRKTREPLSRRATEWVFGEALRRGLLTMAYTARVRINPPLVITAEQAAEGVGILDEVLGELAKRPSEWRS